MTRTSRLLAIAPAALLLLGACSSLSAEEQRALDSYTETAESYYRLGDNDRAVAQALKGLEIDRENYKLQLLLAWSLVRRGTTEDVTRAEQVFRRIADEDDFRAPLGLAQSLERLGVANDEAATAIETGKRVTEAADPKLRAAELRKHSLALWDESQTWYQRTLALQAANLDALNGLQRVAALLGHREESLAWSDRLIEALQTDRAFWEERIRRTGLDDRQESEIRRILRRTTQLEVESRLTAAMMLRELGRPADAARHLDAAIELSPDRGDLYAQRGLVRKELQSWDGAIQDIERFIALSKKGFDTPEMSEAWRVKQECETQRAAASKPN